MIVTSGILVLSISALAHAANVRRVTCPDGTHTATNEACCAFFSLADDLQQTLFESDGKLQGNGADGSIITFSDTETAFVENAFTDDAVAGLQPFLLRHNVTPGDLIQFASAVALTNCPGAPQLGFLSGRPVATVPAQEGSVPQPQDSVDTILSRFADVGLSAAEVVSLDAWHTIYRIDGFVPGHDSVPLDTTPFTFDSQIFLEVLLKGVGFPFNVTNPTGGEVESPLPAEGEVRLQSDFALARDNRTACDWQNNIGDQASMAQNFRAAFAKVAVIGQDVSSFNDCSEAVPSPVPFSGPDCFFPAGTNSDDLQQVCPSPFPTCSTATGTPTPIPLCPPGSSGCPS